MEIIFGVLVPAAGLVIAWLSYLKAHPKRQLKYSFRVTPFLSVERSSASKLQVTYAGEVVKNPYLISFELWSTGRADVPSARFDNGNPLQFDIGSPIIEVTAVHSDQAAQLYQADPTTIGLQPTLIPRKFRARIDVVVSDTPTVTLAHNTLIDVGVVSVDRQEIEQKIQGPPRRGWVMLVWISGAAAIVGFIVLIIGAIVFPAETNPTGFNAVAIPGTLLFLLGAATVLFTLLAAGIRWLVDRFGG